MKQRTLFFVLLMLSTLTASAYDAKINGIFYNLNSSTKQATVTYGDTEYTNSVAIPATITYHDVTYSVRFIEKSAFSECPKLKSVTIPNSVISIGDKAFWHCTGLTSITIPNSVTSIGNYAFAWCSYLKTITIPNSVTTIGHYAFEYCYALISIEIPDNVTSIGLSAFYECYNLTSVKIGRSVTSIGNNAFYYCYRLTSITIPNKVTKIGVGAFEGCSCLTSVTCEATSVPSTGSSAFTNVPLSSAKLYVPNSALEAYKTTAPWSGFGAFEELPIPKCETPTISFIDGNLTFSCETEDVEFVYNITSSISGEGAHITLPNKTKYRVTVYATKDGYDNSDVATKDIEVGGGGSAGIRGDVNYDNEVGMPDVMFIVNYILNGKFPDE